MKVFYSPMYVRSQFGFATTRKAQWIADSLSKFPITGVELFEPESLDVNQVSAVHDYRYVRAIETGEPRELAESQELKWDSGFLPMVLSSNGGAVAAARAAMKDGVAGSLSSGLHHARRDRGAGYCTFNGLVIAANDILASGAKSVLILDLDAHCGGGTASMILSDPRVSQVDIAVSKYDRYESTLNASLTIVENSADYNQTLLRLLDETDRKDLAYDLCIYNAGMDPYEGCPEGGLEGMTMDVLSKRESIVFEWCSRKRLPVAFVLAGGYIGPKLSEAVLVDLHRLTLSAACTSFSSKSD
ncbi:MAG: hypothetical protein A3J97_06820 [Spirochaetes bacterium RIFOXYC1_FULL_54_7]|nr:MAG: hypothetical protein A3J97_06820 [Spirochaetes bacterium RIFOXYC1_FULL_54_7]